MKTITDVGQTITCTTSPETNELPVPSGARAAKYARFVCDSVAYLKLGTTDQVNATDQDIMLTSTPTILDVSATPYFSVIATSAGPRVNVTVFARQ